MNYFNNSYKGSYFSAMDRGYSPVGDALDSVPEMAGLSPAVIGISAPPMQNQLEALQAKIRQGASRVELGFTGRGKGSMGQGSPTPEMYGMEERRDMKELARINRIALSTHATTAIGSLSGLTENGFNEMAREQAYNEVRRAIDFAADVTDGGAIVVHTGEFQRPLNPYYDDFMMTPAEAGKLPGERKKAVFNIVDSRTGQVIPVRTDQPVPLPVYKVDSQGRYIYEKDGSRVVETEMDPNTGLESYKIAVRDWDYFENEARKWNLEHQNEKPRTPELQYHIEQLDMRRQQLRALSFFYGGVERVKEVEEQLGKIQKAKVYYEELERNTPESEKWRLIMPLSAGELRSIIPPDIQMPTEWLKDREQQLKAQLQHLKHGALTYTQEARQIEETQNNLLPIREYAVKKSADTIARAALFAMQKSQQMHTKEPLFVAPENIFAETYGSHPQELKELVLASRKSMTQELQYRFGYSADQAKELAAQHIKATFDVGHGQTWRKYFIGDPNRSIQENDAAFKRWLLTQTKDLIEAGVLGHVHISDNFGYEDEHVDPGMGKAPIKEFIEQLKKAAKEGKTTIKDVIVEPAHQDYRALLGGWRHFGSSIYGLSRPAGDTWSDVWRSYFGQTAPPYFIYGEAAPDPENWVLWTGTRLE